MSDAALRCPACGKMAAPGDRFCDACRRPLAGDAEPAPSAEAPADPAVENIVRVLANAAPPPPTPILVVEENLSAAATRPGTKPSSTGGGSADLDAEYNLARVFVEGVTVPFQLRITPRRADIDALFVEIRHDEQTVARSEPDEYLEAGSAVDVYLPFRPWAGLKGKEVPFKIYVGYEAGGERRCFTTEKLHTVFRAKEKARNVLQAVNISLHNELKDLKASDPTIHQQLPGLDRLMPAADDPADEIRNVDIPPLWQPLALRRCKFHGRWPEPNRDSFRIPAVPAQAVVPRLTLRAGEHVVQLLSGTALQMGRKGTCDLITRFVAADGSAPEEPNTCISKYHGRLELDGRRCHVVDRAYDPDKRSVVSSTHGLFIDGTRVASAAPTSLPKERECTISFAGADADHPETLSFRARMIGARAAGLAGVAEDEPCALVLTRRGPARETIAIVWRQLPLRLLHAGFGDGDLLRDQDAFLARQGNRCEWLVPGKPAVLGKQRVEVSTYKALGT